jgi:hypothetical protein
MRIISIWQPWASLIIHGHKFIETRGWAAPKSVIKQTIGIAATKNILPDQRFAAEEPAFKRFYAETGLPPLDELPRGCVLGTAFLNSCDPIGEDFVEDITDEEQAFGWYQVGRFAWRLRYPKPFDEPAYARGAQGLWEADPHGIIAQQKAQRLHGPARQEGPETLRRHLHLA